MTTPCTACGRALATKQTLYTVNGDPICEACNARGDVEPTTCRLCKTGALIAPIEIESQLCTACRIAVHAVPLPPPRRPPIPCSRCGGFRFIRSMIRELVTIDATSFLLGVSWTGAVQVVPLPVAMTWAVHFEQRVHMGVVAVGSGIKLGEPRGLLARYMCSGCGFVEVFCDQPESVPIGPEYSTDVVDFTPSR